LNALRSSALGDTTTRKSASILCNDPFAGSPTEALLQL
jgi:hypothetical protein